MQPIVLSRTCEETAVEMHPAEKFAASSAENRGVSIDKKVVMRYNYTYKIEIKENSHEIRFYQYC